MKCNHCGAMRDAEAGLRIGGVALPTVIPPPPCTHLVKVNDGTDTEFLGTELSGDQILYRWLILRRRFVPVVNGMVTPSVVSASITNYPPGTFDLNIGIRSDQGDVVTCDPDTGANLGITDWLNGDYLQHESYETVVDNTQFIYVWIFIIATNIGTPFADQPIVDLVIKFERP